MPCVLAAGPSLVRPSMRALRSDTSFLLGTQASSLSSAGTSFTTQASGWERVPLLMPSGTSPLVQLTGEGVGRLTSATAVRGALTGAAEAR